MDDPLFSHESLLSPERLFGAVIEWRKKIIEQSANEAYQALDAMNKIHPTREYHNKKLFMSSVARDMDLLASGVVESTHDRDMAEVTPIHTVKPEVAITDQAHIEYLNAMTQDHFAEQEKVIPEDAIRLRNARQNLDLIYGNRAA